MKIMNAARLFISGVAVMLCACGGGGDTSTSTSQAVNLVGTWSGTIVSGVYGSLPMSVNLQSGNTLTGPITVSGLSGGLEVTEIGNTSASLRLVATNGTCIGVYGGTATIGQSGGKTTMTALLSGSIGAPCNTQDGGTITLTK